MLRTMCIDMVIRSIWQQFLILPIGGVIQVLRYMCPMTKDNSRPMKFQQINRKC